MSFSKEVKKEIEERLRKKSGDFTFSQNTDSINPAHILAELFLQSGSVNDPEASYHLEIVCDNEDSAKYVYDLMNGLDFAARITRRKEKYIVYLKDRETIADFLGTVGAVKSMLKMENSLILKDMRNSVNRKVNFEAANIEKTVSAAVREIEDIRYIEANGGLKQLPEGLRKIAELRMEQPDASLKVLGESMDPPLGKSGVNHRLRKIRNFAEKLKVSRGECYEKM